MPLLLAAYNDPRSKVIKMKYFSFILYFSLTGSPNVANTMAQYRSYIYAWALDIQKYKYKRKK